MNKINHTIKNITNSGLEQVSFKKGTTIYKVNEKPKFAYYVYTGKVNIISKDEYNIGIIQEGEFLFLSKLKTFDFQSIS